MKPAHWIGTISYAGKADGATAARWLSLSLQGKIGSIYLFMEPDTLKLLAYLAQLFLVALPYTLAGLQVLLLNEPA